MSVNNHWSGRSRAYLAAPLFSDAERIFNLNLSKLLEEHLDVYLPQRDGGLISEMIKMGIPSDDAACQVFQKDMEAIKQADFVIAILDGRSIDEGVAFEIGVGYCQSKRCIGLQTDSRRLAAWGNNPMITGALEYVFMSIEDLLVWIKSEAFETEETSSKSQSGSLLKFKRKFDRVG